MTAAAPVQEPVNARRSSLSLRCQIRNRLMNGIAYPKLYSACVSQMRIRSKTAGRNATKNTQAAAANDAHAALGDR